LNIKKKYEHFLIIHFLTSSLDHYEANIFSTVSTLNPPQNVATIKWNEGDDEENKMK